MSYKPTGFPPGRPRNGEIRQPTEQSLAWHAKVSLMKSIDPEGWNEYNAQRMREWRAKNPAKVAIYSARQQARIKALKKASPADFDVAGPFVGKYTGK